MSKKITPASESISGFKAFDQNLKCRDFQFEIGATYTHKGRVGLCESGFHFCEDPLHVLSYYPPNSRFCRVTASEVLAKTSPTDDKRVSRVITIGDEILLPQLIEASVALRIELAGDAVVRDVVHSGAATASGDRGAATASGYRGAATASGDSGAATASGDRGAATASGDRGAATASGYRGAATASGYRGAATASGDSGAATASGDRGAATASGDRGAATASGDSGAATASGDRGAATASGDRGAATASGDESCAVSLGVEGRAKASLGSWITLAEWKYTDRWHRIDVQTTKVNGKNVKADTWYMLTSGKFVEVK